MGKTYTKNKRVIYREEGEGAFLFDPADGNLKYLNRSAKEIFQMLTQTPNTAHIVAALHDTYPDADQDRLREDVTFILDQMVDNNFVFPVDVDST